MFTCRLDECPPGLFMAGDCLGFKSEYRNDQGDPEAFVVSSGESFWGGVKTSSERSALRVIPVEVRDASALRMVSIEQEF